MLACFNALPWSDFTTVPIAAITRIIAPTSAVIPSIPCVYLSVSMEPSILTVAAINNNAIPRLSIAVFNPSSLKLLLSPSNSTADLENLSIAIAIPANATDNTIIAPTDCHNLSGSTLEKMSTAPASINAANATFCIAFVFFSNAEALRFFFIALPTPSIASEIDSITAKGDVSLSAASANLLATNSMPTPAPAETILLILSPSFNSLNFSNISEPNVFIVSQTFDDEFLIPLIRPSTKYSPSASVSFEGE